MAAATPASAPALTAAASHQRAFLASSQLTPDVIASTISQLVGQQECSLWVATAVVHALQGPTRVADLAVASSLVDLGLTAAGAGTPSSPPRGDADALRAQLHAQLSVIRDSLSAFEKTGVRAVPTDDDVAVADEDEGDEDDEESSWFDAAAASPSPSPSPSAAPSIPLASLLPALSNPPAVAKLLAPYPSRLAVWLQSIPRPTFQQTIYPQRLDIVHAALVHFAIVGDDEGVKGLQSAGLLLEASSDLWTHLCDDVDDVAAASQSRPQQALSFYLSEVRELEETYGNATIALQLARVALALSSGAAATDVQRLRQQLTEYADQLAIFLQVGPSEQAPTSTALQRHLLTRPQDVLLDVGDDVDVSMLLKPVIDRQASSQQEIVTRAVFEQYRRRGLVSPHLLQAIGHQTNVADVVASLLLSCVDAESARGLNQVATILTQSGEDTGATSMSSSPLRRCFPPLHGDVARSLKTAPPSAEAIHHHLREDGLTQEQRSSLLARCAQWINNNNGKAVGLPPWSLILSQGQPDAQLALLKHIISERLPSCSTLAACQALQASLRLPLLDSVDPMQITSELLRALLIHNRHHLFAEIGLSANIDSASLEQVIISSARYHFDRTAGGRNGVDDLKKARACLELAPSPPSPAITASERFLAAVIRLMQVTRPLSSALHSSLPLAPLEVRLSRDRLAVIKNWLSRGEDAAWKRPEDVIDTAMGLCEDQDGTLASGGSGDEGGNGKGDAIASTSSSSSFATSSSGPLLLHVQLYAMLADAAIAHGDLSLTSQYAASLLKAHRDVVKRRKASTSTSDAADVAAARETTWLTLFSLAKHPSAATDVQLQKYWLAEALAHAPADRTAEILKRYRAIESSDENESGGQDILSGMSAASLPSSPLPSSLLRLPTGASAAAAVHAASGLGAGVFGLAAGAMSSMRGGGGGGGTAGGGEMMPPSVAVSGPTSPASAPWGSAQGLGTALSSLAGSFTEGYGTRLTGFLGSGGGSGGGGGGGGVAAGQGLGAARPSPSPSSPRTAASLFDNLGGGGSNDTHRQPTYTHSNSSQAPPPRTSAPHTQYLDPAERAARAARGFFSGLRGVSSGGGSGKDDSSDRSASPASTNRHVSGGTGAGGWASRATRGMDWLLDDETRQ